MTTPRDFWNQWNARWRAAHEASWTPDEAARRRHETILAWLRARDVRDADILDVSCGAGWLSDALRAFGRVTGVDIADETVAEARARFPAVTFIAGDFYTVDLPAESWDVVVCVDGISCVPDPAAFVRRMAERLRPGGHLIAATPNRFVWERVERDGQSAAPIRHWHSRGELRSLLAPWFEVLRLRTVAPGGHTGLLRIVNSYKVEAVLARAGLATAWRWARERLGVGRSFVVLCRLRPRAAARGRG